MKHEKQLTALTAALLAFVTALGAAGCLTSAFDLNLEYPAGPALVCGMAALLCAACFSCRYGGTAILCLAALACGYMHHDGRAAEQLWQLLQRLTTVYDRAYGWGVLQVTDAPWDGGFADWPLGILGAVIAAAVSRCVCRQKSVWPPVLLTLLPLCACVVVTDTVPGAGWLMLVMAGLVLLILPSSVRRENAAQGVRLTAGAALPTALALLALFLAVPQEGYVNRTKILQENIITAAENLPQLVETGFNKVASNLQGEPPKQVDLAGLGARIPFTYPVMEVTAEGSGALYLRGQDYDVYDGLGWMASEDRREDFSRNGDTAETITIRTRKGRDIRYLPYYPTGETVLAGGAAENPGEEREYTVARSILPENWRQTAYQPNADAQGGWQEYLSLPDATRQGAQELLAGLYDPDASHTEKADIIAAMVTNSAPYDMNTEKMPETEGDFALWFLREGERGYCVHFATAATVLLRAAEIPARYVTGYMLEAEAGQTITVTEENAHAWAEYYEPNLDAWIPLEATPASELPEETDMPLAVATETTEPAKTTEAETEATELPTQTETVPTESTVSAIQDTLPTEPEQTEAPVEIPVLTILFLPGLLLALAAQRALRLKLRRRRQRTGDPNRQALERWKEAVRLSRLLKESPTEELIVLAQKAKFSQHELTQEELQCFDSHNRTCLRRLKEKPGYMQLLYRYLYAVY